MNPSSTQLPAFWPLAVYFAADLFLVGSILGLSYVLGQRHKGRAKDQPYESGIMVTGSARVRYDVKFYLNAMFFVIFDLEAAFIFAWAVTAREVGWAGYFEILIFIGILAAALVYLWRLKALDWQTLRERKSTTLERKGK